MAGGLPPARALLEVLSVGLLPFPRVPAGEIPPPLPSVGPPRNTLQCRWLRQDSPSCWAVRIWRGIVATRSLRKTSNRDGCWLQSMWLLENYACASSMLPCSLAPPTLPVSHVVLTPLYWSDTILLFLKDMAFWSHLLGVSSPTRLQYQPFFTLSGARLYLCSRNFYSKKTPQLFLYSCMNICAQTPKLMHLDTDSKNWTLLISLFYCGDVA